MWIHKPAQLHASLAHFILQLHGGMSFGTMLHAHNRQTMGSVINTSNSGGRNWKHIFDPQVLVQKLSGAKKNYRKVVFFVPSSGGKIQCMCFHFIPPEILLLLNPHLSNSTPCLWTHQWCLAIFSSQVGLICNLFLTKEFDPKSANQDLNVSLAKLV